MLEKSVVFDRSVETPETIVTLSKILTTSEAKKTAIEQSVAAFLECCKDLSGDSPPAATQATSDTPMTASESDSISDRLNIFVRIRVTDNVKAYFSGDRYEQFCKSLLVKSQVREKN
ncbi:MAG: hypothetical protein LRY69_06275 [Gammaproteobacteria bacterium]|nr:hypothetical protein [Gammaproteobacteria bacterium]